MQACVEKKLKEVEDKVKSKDWEGLKKCYAEKATFLPSSGETVCGISNLIEYCKKFADYDYSSKLDNVCGDDNWSIARGCYTAKNGTECGSFVTVLTKCNGEWVIFLDAWTGGPKKC